MSGDNYFWMSFLDDFLLRMAKKWRFLGAHWGVGALSVTARSLSGMGADLPFLPLLMLRVDSEDDEWSSFSSNGVFICGGTYDTKESPADCSPLWWVRLVNCCIEHWPWRFSASYAGWETVKSVWLLRVHSDCVTKGGISCSSKCFSTPSLLPRRKYWSFCWTGPSCAIPSVFERISASLGCARLNR